MFLSVIVVLRNQSELVENLLKETTGFLADLVSDYELIIVDNASEDDSISILKSLAGENGLPNLQVYALTKEVDKDTASSLGLENSLGDFVVAIDPFTEGLEFLPVMLEKATNGIDVVFASNDQKVASSRSYRYANSIFNRLYKWFNDIRLAEEAPPYRVLSKNVVNFILQHPQPAITYRHLPATGGFSRVNLKYSSVPTFARKKHLRTSLDQGIRLLVSTTHTPMRLVTTLSLFGAAANLIYSVYILAIALLKDDVAAGWVSLSLQQSGMFFLISIVLLILGEYILHMASLTNEGPKYHVAQEFSSALITRHEKLNIEEGVLNNSGNTESYVKPEP